MAVAGTITVSRSADHGRAAVFKVSIAWVSSAGGAVTENYVPSIVGVLTRATFVPAGGALAPDDNYDVTLLDEDGVDLLVGLGANRDTANTEHVAPMLGAGTNVPVVVVGRIQPVVANAGASNAGTIHLYFDRR